MMWRAFIILMLVSVIPAIALAWAGIVLLPELTLLWSVLALALTLIIQWRVGKVRWLWQ